LCADQSAEYAECDEKVKGAQIFFYIYFYIFLIQQLQGVAAGGGCSGGDYMTVSGIDKLEDGGYSNDSLIYSFSGED